MLCAAQYFDGGDAWYTPLFKIVVDQSAWSVAWNSLYYVLLGEPRARHQVDADAPHGLFKKIDACLYAQETSMCACALLQTIVIHISRLACRVLFAVCKRAAALAQLQERSHTLSACRRLDEAGITGDHL